MIETFNPPDTPEEAEQALDAIFARIVRMTHRGLDDLAWFDRYEKVRDYARGRWPDQFPMSEQED